MRTVIQLSMVLATAICLPGDSMADWNTDILQATELRELGRHAEAYETAAGNESESPAEAYERNFLAGWIALRDLNRPGPATAHFRKMSIASGKLGLKGKRRASAESQSRYWLAKALSLDGQAELSRALMKEAGEGTDTFYGQLAQAELGTGPDAGDIQRLSDRYPDFQYNWHDERVEKELVLAMIREESGFDANAKSHAGAIGLMQIMPATAEEAGLAHGVRTDTEKLGTNPDYNIAFGSNYLARLMQRYQGNTLLATAAYNAGPSNVDKWLKRFGDPRETGTDPVEWVESIPFRETRHYVKNVISSYVAYEILSGSRGEHNSR